MDNDRMSEKTTDTHNKARAPLVVFAAMAATGYIMSRFIEPGTTYIFAVHSLISSAIFMIAIDRRRGFAIAKPDRAPIIFAGCGLAVIPFLVLEGSRAVSPSLASILVISNALMIAVMTWALGRNTFNHRQVVALITGFAGVVWISFEQGNVSGRPVGVVYLLVAATLIAMTTVAMERTVQKIGGLAATKRMMMAAVPVGIIILLITDHGVVFHSPTQSALGFLFGLISLGAPVLLFNVGMSMIGAADAANYKLLIPFFALLYGAIVIGETPEPELAVAGLVTVVSVALYQRAGVAPTAESGVELG